MSLSALKGDVQRVVGMKETTRALQKNIAKIIFVAKDADAKITQPILEECEKKNIPYNIVESMQALGKACGIQAGAAVAATIEY